jgi:hypothetical protein
MAMVVLASRVPCLDESEGISSEWNQAAPGNIHARKAGETVETKGQVQICGVNNIITAHMPTRFQMQEQQLVESR